MERKLTLKEKVLRRAKRDKKKSFRHSLVLLVISGVFIFSFPFISKPGAMETTEDSEALLTASFVGDIMLGRHVENIAERHGYDYVFRNVAPIFQESDYVSGNFEHPVVLKDDYRKAEKPIHLHTSSDAVKALKEMNFTVLTLANNHAMDYGVAGLRDTLQTFEKYGLDYVGAGEDVKHASNIVYQDVNGLTIASIGVTDKLHKGASAHDKKPGVLPANPDIFLPLIKKASEQADLVIVNIHWGQEYDNDSSPKQRQLAKAMVDAGADIIIGHHPHVLSTVEVYKNSLIFYSLGNFVFDQGWSRTKDSAIVNYKLYWDGTGRVEIIPLRIKEATPSPIGAGGIFYKERIFRTFTKDAPAGLWKKEDDKLILELDHSHILEGVDPGGE